LEFLLNFGNKANHSIGNVMDEQKSSEYQHCTV
jgi:hypothetical protein